MPEGHTVHRIAQLFSELFAGQVLTASSPQGRFSEGAALVSGATLLTSQAIGKQLFLGFDADRCIRVHLGIYGAWDLSTRSGELTRAGSPDTVSLGAPRVRRRIGETEASISSDVAFPPPPVGQVRLRLETEDVVADLRGPTACELITLQQREAIEARLGPDPMHDRGKKGGVIFAQRLARTSRAIGLVLMDQGVVSGIGNVYRAEILFRHRLDPYRSANTLDAELVHRLWKDWGVLLARGVKTGVMMTRDDLDAKGRAVALEERDERYFVYGRQGQPCRACGTPIVMAMMATRKLYFCPLCQTSIGRSS